MHIGPNPNPGAIFPTGSRAFQKQGIPAWLPILGIVGLAILPPLQAATIRWSNPAGGCWDVTNNWAPAQVPGPADTAVISGNATFTVRLCGYTSVGSLQLGGSNGVQSLAINTNLLTSSGSILVRTNATLIFDGGTIQSCTNLCIEGALALTTAADKNLYQVNLYNRGFVTWNDGPIRTRSTLIDNRGIWDARGRAAISWDGFGSATMFENRGIVCAHSNALVQLQVDGTGSGTFLATNGGAIQFERACHFLGTNCFLGSSGSIRLMGYGLLLDGNVVSENLELASGSLSGSVRVSGAVKWSGGEIVNGAQVVIAADGEFNLVGMADKRLRSSAIRNEGTLNWEGGDIVCRDTSLDNLGRWNGHTSAAIQWEGFGSPPAFNNMGTVLAHSNAVMRVQVGGTGSGSFVVTNDAAIQFESDYHFAGTNLFLGGSGSIRFTGYGIQLNGRVFSENLELAGGSTSGSNAISGVLTWSAGRIDADARFGIAPDGVLNLVSTGDKTLRSAVLRNEGVVNWFGGDFVTRNAAIHNAGIWNVHTNAAMLSDAFGSDSFTNSGTFRKLVGNGTTTIGLTLFQNSGIVDVWSGTVAFYAGTYVESGGTLSFGIRSLTDFGRCAFTGPVMLGGALRVLLLDGFTPLVGQCMDLITYSTNSCVFAVLELPGDVQWRTSYNPGKFTLCVTAPGVNTAPVFKPLPDQTIDEQATLTLSIFAIDRDVPANAIVLTLLAPPAGMALDPLTHVLTWTPTEAQGPDAYLICIRACDNGTPSLCATQCFQVVVREVNRSPVLSPVSNATVHVCETVRRTVRATDPDQPANPLTYTLLNPPPGAVLDATSGAFSWAPNSFQIGLHSIRVKVSDSSADSTAPSLSATQTFLVSVLSSQPVLQIDATNGMARLEWNTCVGTTYKLQCKAVLGCSNPPIDSCWIDLPPDVLATSERATRLVPILPGTNRFYRVQQLP